MSEPLVQVDSLTVRYPLRGDSLFTTRWLTAVASVSFDLGQGETLGVVGESGCGKSTLGRALLGLVDAQEGRVLLGGERVDLARGERLRRLRRQAQMVFQDPLGSLDPRMTVGQSVAEPLQIFERSLGRSEIRSRVEAVLGRVGLAPEHADRYPHEFSGGQCQRIGIARAIVLRPRLIVCDEAVSALDVSVQGQVVNLLRELRRDLGLAYLFISHNLAIVRHISDRVLVMYLGRAMELADRNDIYQRPLHPYTRALLDSIPTPDPRAAQDTNTAPVAGELPSPLSPPQGCVFCTRCRYADRRCHERRPGMEEARAGHRVACHRCRDWPDGLTPQVES